MMNDIYTDKTEVMERSYKPTSVVGEILGTRKITTTYTDMLNIGKILLIIAGSDGQISDEEMNYYFGFTRGLNAPDSIVDDLKKFDWKTGRIEDCLSRVSLMSTSERRRLLYMGIKVASADGDYDAVEQRTINDVGKHFRIDPDHIKAIENMVMIETALAHTRYRLFDGEITEKPDTEEPVYEATSQNRELLGERYLIHRDLLNIGKIILIIAGADGVMSKDEFDYFLGFGKGMGADTGIMREWTQFDWRNSDLSEHIAKLSHYNEPRRFRILYSAIKVAWSDDVYAYEERKAGERAGHILEVQPPMIKAIETQIFVERAMISALHDIFTN